MTFVLSWHKHKEDSDFRWIYWMINLNGTSSLLGCSWLRGNCIHYTNTFTFFVYLFLKTFFFFFCKQSNQPQIISNKSNRSIITFLSHRDGVMCSRKPMNVSFYWLANMGCLCIKVQNRMSLMIRLGCWVLWHINLSRSFNAKSIFM